jgi:hypothetical protein
MVLTNEELLLAESSNIDDIQLYYETRKKANTLIEQALADKQIQCLLSRKGTIVYNLNCYIIRNIAKYANVLTTTESGWNSDGPTIQVLKDTIKLRIQPKYLSDRLSELNRVKKEKRDILTSLRRVVSRELTLEEDPEDQTEDY